MPSQKNLDSVSLLKTKLQKAKSIVLADYAGLTVNLQRELRQKLKLVAGELIVVKNTLLKLAFEAEKYRLPPELEAALQGPTIILLAYEDEIAPLKILAEFAKDHDLPKIKAGFLAKEPLTAQQLNTLAELPTKIELLTKTVATLKSPLFGFVNVLSANIRNLLYALRAIRQLADQKEVN